MRIERPEQSWCVVLAADGRRLCLQRLALRCGYRMEEMCGELGCRRCYLYEVFLRDVGLSPKEWLRRERIVVARRMLTGGRTADEVSERLGFARTNNFRREFLTYHRVGPVEFQRERWGWGEVRSEKREVRSGREGG